MDIKLIGLLVIGVILVAIITAFIFSSKFRSDVIASEGEAAVLGLINVKGVIIVLLTAIFGGIFVYILTWEPAGNIEVIERELTTKAALNYLRDTDADHYKIRAQGDSLKILANSVPIGTLELSSSQRLLSTRNQQHSDRWNVNLDKNVTVGYVGLATENGYLQWDERDSVGRMTYEVGTPYKIKNLDLYFRIDSITRYQRSGTRYKYYTSFGEGERASNIHWSEENEQFEKTPDGKIYVNEEFRALRDPNWHSDYFLKLGVGQPSTANDRLGFVEKLNVVAVEVRVR